VNEVVARLLGWMPGDKRCEGIPKRKSGSSDNQSPVLLSLDEPYKTILSDRCDAARLEEVAARDANAEPEIIQEKRDASDRVVEEYGRAKSYESAIYQELDKGDESDLRIAHRATAQRGVLCIFHSGLHGWAQKKYKSSVFEFLKDTSSHGRPIAHSEQVGWSAGGLHHTSHGRPIAHSEQGADESSLKGGLSKVKAVNLYTTFSFLVELYSKTLPKLHHENDSPKVDRVADSIKKYAFEKNGDRTLASQSIEAIKERIEDAAKIQRSRLPLVPV